MNRYLTYALCLTCILGATACAPAGNHRPLPQALTQAECAGLAAGRLPDGRPVAQAYDSLYVLAKERPTLDADDLQVIPRTSSPRETAQSVSAMRTFSIPPGYRRTGGRARVAYLIGVDGKTSRVRLLQSTGDPVMDRFAIDRLATAEFTPARNRDCPVPIFKVATFR